MFNDSAQGRDMTDAVNVAKAATAGTGVLAGIATWLGVVLPPLILVLTFFTLTCTAVVYVYRGWQWWKARQS